MTMVSVVIPSYNHAKYVAGAIESALRQTLGDLEVVVVDDGSTDGSVDIISRIRDKRVRLMTQSNQGAHAAINKGLLHAQGAYIAILNSDDEFPPERLEMAIEYLRQRPGVSLLGTHIEVIDEGGKRIGVKHGIRDLEPWVLDDPGRSFRAESDLRAALLCENYLSSTSNFVMPREWCNRIGGFRPLRFTHDWDYALRASQVGEIAVLPNPLLRYRVHPANTIRADFVGMSFEICWVLAVHLPILTKEDWFIRVEIEKRVDQLLHSVFTYGADRVLEVMLILGLSEDQALATALLDVNNPIRQRLLEFITVRATRRDASTASSVASDAPSRILASLRKLKRG